MRERERGERRERERERESEPLRKVLTLGALPLAKY